MTTTVLAARGLCRPGPLAPGWLAADEGLVVEVGAGPPPPGAEDLGDVVLAPAFVDLQVNGVGDIDLARLRKSDRLGGLINEYWMVA